MIDYGQAIADLMNLHGKIAHDVFPKGGTLICTACGQTQPFTEQQGAQYLRDGWPKHCGHEMAVASRE
jgi:hypothetical protein